MKLTGDLHGDTQRIWGVKDRMRVGEHLIVCGDAGFLFYPPEREEYFVQKMWLDQLESLPFSILWVDGNHENFDLLRTYPVEYWNGGKIHRIRKNVLHLMRGQIFTIEGQTVFTMGGAYSRDKDARKPHLSWWAEELPDNSEYREAEQNLREANYTVDLIVSHTTSRYNIRRMGKTVPHARDAELTGFFNWVEDNVHFRHWYFGHWHQDTDLTEKHHLLYETVVDAL